MNDEVTELKKLLLDENFTNIQTLVNEEINLMSILRIAHKELQHSNLLAWLFDPNETHKLNDFFLKEFIKLYYKENEYKDLGNTKSKLSVFDFINLDFSDLEIRREHANIDILILSKSNGFCIMIENKIYAREGHGQLEKYRTYIETKYPEYKYKIYIYLSLFEQEISESESENYVKLTYQHIKKLLDQILNNESTTIANNTKFVLTQYIQTLKTLMNENEEIEKIAQDLYSKYKSSFDLVFKYAHPSSITHPPNNLLELINKTKGIKPFKSSKSYVRFQPNFLNENIQYLRDNDFIKQNDDLTTSWLFLFEFHVTRSCINFDMKIGDYSSQKHRLKLYELFQKNEHVFNKVNSRKNSLSPTWHLSFRKTILKASEYNKYVDGEINDINDIIKERFNDLIAIDLPKIRKIIISE
ncbi:MAG: PD-(D/E)XK nuclease family protein [Desulfotalea sp.]